MVWKLYLFGTIRCECKQDTEKYTFKLFAAQHFYLFFEHVKSLKLSKDGTKILYLTYFQKKYSVLFTFFRLFRKN